jgi:adenylate cyclase
LELTFEHLGEREVKNIAEPVTVYRVAVDEMAATLVTPFAFPAPAKHRGRWPVAMGAVAVLVLIVGGALAWRPWAPDIKWDAIRKTARPVLDKPSIAVLPFANLSGDKEQEYFADGITDDLITDLAERRCQTYQRAASDRGKLA